jgi:hypothetical protein
MLKDAGVAAGRGRTGVVLAGGLAALVVFAAPAAAQRRSSASGRSGSSRGGHGNVVSPIRLPAFGARLPGFATWDGLTHPEAWGAMGGSLGVRDIFDGRAGMRFVRPGAVGRSGTAVRSGAGFTTLGTFGGAACVTRLSPGGCSYARRTPLIGSAGIGLGHSLGRGPGYSRGAFGYYSAPSYRGYYGTGYRSGHGSGHGRIYFAPGYFGGYYAPYHGSTYLDGYGGSYYGGSYYGDYIDGYDVGASGVEQEQTGASGQGGVAYDASTATAGAAGGHAGVPPAGVRPVTGCAEVAVLLASSGSWTRVPVPLPALGADTPAGLGAVVGSSLARGKPLVLEGFDGLRVMVPAGPDVKQAVVQPCRPLPPPGGN